MTQQRNFTVTKPGSDQHVEQVLLGKMTTSECTATKIMVTQILGIQE